MTPRILIATSALALTLGFGDVEAWTETDESEGGPGAIAGIVASDDRCDRAEGRLDSLLGISSLRRGPLDPHPCRSLTPPPSPLIGAPIVEEP